MEDVQALREALGENISSLASDGELKSLIQSQQMSPVETWKPFFNLLYYITGCRVDQGESHWATPMERAVWTYHRFINFRQQLGRDDKKVNEIRSSKFLIWHGRDRLKRPLCWIRPGLSPKGYETLDVARWYQSTMDMGCELADSTTTDPTGVQAFSVVFDRRGMEYPKSRENASECRMVIGRYAAEFGQVLLDMYFSRFGEVYVLGASWVFWAYWKISQPFILPEGREKMHVLNRPEDLLNYMDISEVPEPWYSELSGKKKQS